MYDIVLLENVRIGSNGKLPAGTLSSRKEAKPLVHRGSQKWKCGAFDGEFFTEVENETNRLRFAQIVNFHREPLNKNGTVHTFSLFRDLSDLKPNVFEQLLGDEIGHLEAIVANPVLDLRREELKMPISRVKRFSSRALSHLSSHSEDWQQRTFTAVIPKSLHALVQEDLWSTYENRLLVSLCSRIDKYLTQRLTAYSQIERSFDEIFEFYQNRPDYYQKTRERYDRRVAAYFGKDTPDKESEKVLKGTKEKLEKLQKIIRKFWTSQLFNHLKIFPPVNLDNIHLTNLLQHHQHYRYIVKIRNAYLKNQGIITEKSPENFEQEQLDFCVDISRYTKLCIQQILKEDGYLQIEESKFIQDDCTLDLNLRGSEVILSSQSSKDERHVRFLSIPCDPGDYYQGKKSRFIGDTVIVYPAPGGIITFEDRKVLEDLCLSFPQIGSINKIGVSPLSIFSEEIFAAIIIKWLKIPILQKYPKRISKVPSIFTEFISHQKYSNCLESKLTDIAVLKPLDGISADILQNDFKKFRWKFRKHNQDLQLSAIIEDLLEGSNLAENVSTCLVCGRKADQFQPNNYGNFNSQCRPCNAKWGKNKNGEYFFRVERDSCERSSDLFTILGRYGEISSKG